MHLPRDAGRESSLLQAISHCVCEVFESVAHHGAFEPILFQVRERCVLCVFVESQAETNASWRCTSEADKLHAKLACVM